MVILFALRYEREGRPQINQLLEMLATDGSQQYAVRASPLLLQPAFHISILLCCNFADHCERHAIARMREQAHRRLVRQQELVRARLEDRRRLEGAHHGMV